MSLVEYTDLDNSKSYTDGDSIASVYRIGKDRKVGSAIIAVPPTTIDFWAYQSASSDTTTNGVSMSMRAFSFSSNDDVFTLKFNFMNVLHTNDRDEILATPTQTKFDVLVQGYPYQGKDTRLALVMRMESKTTAVIKDADEALLSKTVTKQVTYGADASLSWSNEFTSYSDGVPSTKAVLSSTMIPPAKASAKISADEGATDSSSRSGEAAELLVFSFDAIQPSRIEWDPTMGTSATVDEYVPVAPTPAASSSSGAGVAVSILVAIASCALFLF